MRISGDISEVLTPVEMRVLRCLGQGITTAGIATALERSVKTVETHYSRMKSRLGLVNLRELIRVAVLFMERGEYGVSLERPGMFAKEKT